ncbi:MAG TPA: hypothetical protein DCM40_24520, partial [Maribacter sp.]|nr:hypothetical protein [Maribacter sp.]
RAAFDKFYDRVNMPARSRDYQFGPGHYRKFTGIMGKDRASMPGTKASKSPMKTMGDFNQNLEQVVRKYMGPYKASITTGDMKRTAAKAVADLKRRTNNYPKVPSVADMEMVLRQAR